MPRAMKICPCTGCGEHEGSCPLIVVKGRCPRCSAAAERKRGNSSSRGYDNRHRGIFRARVLSKDPICECRDEAHGHGPRCYTASTVADHYPLTRRELVSKGMNPNDARHGRGLCESCHNRHTAQTSPGGWAAR